jgi:hypothetical protein
VHPLRLLSHHDEVAATKLPAQKPRWLIMGTAMLHQLENLKMVMVLVAVVLDIAVEVV